MIELKMIQKMISAIETPMNFQLPPNSAMMSAARSARVKRASSSSLTLRDTRERSNSSVRRRRSVKALNISSATSGFFRTNERNASRDRTARRESSVTFASAERLRPSMIDISPKKSPWANSASVTSCLSSSRIVMRTRPLSIRYIASPLSPCRNRRVFCGTTSSESRLRKSRAESSSSEAKSGTERSASSVIWLAGFDMRSSIRDLSILHEHDAIGEAVGELLIVRDHHDRQRIFLNHLAQQREQLMRANRIEVSGRLIGEQHLRVVSERSSNSNALLFATRQLGRFMLQPIAESDTRQQLTRTRASLLSTQTTERQRERHVFTRGHRRNQIEVLKDHADGKTAVARHLFLGKWTNRFCSEVHVALCRVVQSAKHVEQG